MGHRFFAFILFIFYTLPVTAVDHDPDSILISTPLISTSPAHHKIPGFCYNIDNFVKITKYLGLALDNYGANSTVNYMVPVFPHISTFADTLPQISMEKMIILSSKSPYRMQIG